MEGFMMDYTYSISNDTLNGTLYSPKLVNTIVLSSISSQVEKINTSGDSMIVYFTSALSLED
jgi:hypothetical protein